MTRFARRLCFVAGLSAAAIWSLPSARASSIYGTLSNFDIYNTTDEACEGAEIELEDIDPACVGGDYPAHYDDKTIVAYTDDSGKRGTRITYKSYNFPGAPVPGSLMPNPNPICTNGHQLTYSAGGEHFGFWLNCGQPSAIRFFWLNNNNGTYERIGTVPESVPGPTWAYDPPANPGDPPVVQVVIRVPEPAEIVDKKPDSVWMKIFKTKLEDPPEDMQGLLEDLISGDPNDPDYPNIVPQGEVEVETEWELLEGGKNPKEKMKEDELGENDKIIIRRYEFYKYTGPVDAENEPLSNWNEQGDPADIGERGDFIAANMVAAVILPDPIRFDFDADGDIDGKDLEVFEPCATGPTVAGPPAEGCPAQRFAIADADADGDVDQEDFGVFQRCFSGQDVPADPACLQ